MSFILSSAPDPLPPAPALHLLPFALTPTPTTAPISTYFRPRPAPSGHAYAGTGAHLAAFRGRQVVGQTIDVPPGYRGVILRAEALPISASAEESGRGVRRAVRGGGPGVLTPTPSATSIASTSTSTSTDGDDEPAGRTTRSRSALVQKGAGQVALSRPRARRAPARAVQRFALDDDDDEEEEGEKEEPPAKRRATDPDADAESKPEATETEPARETTPPSVPAINVVLATPGKPQDGPADEEDEDMAREVDLSAVVEDVKMAPAEDDSNEAPEAGEAEAGGRIDGARILTPTASFTQFMLWTPDAPLAGFRADELEVETREGDEKEKEGDEAKGKEGREEEESTGGLKLERGWWRQGGAGEGGDEFVRALGEWIGLNEIVSAGESGQTGQGGWDADGRSMSQRTGWTTTTTMMMSRRIGHLCRGTCGCTVPVIVVY